MENWLSPAKLTGTLFTPPVRAVMSYEIIWERRGVVKRFFGYVTNHELMQAVLDTEGDTRFDELQYVINDFVDCTGCSISSEVVDEISAIDVAAAMTNSAIRIAIVATHPDIISAAKQYASSPSNAYPTRIFASLADARDWL